MGFTVPHHSHRITCPWDQDSSHCAPRTQLALCYQASCIPRFPLIYFYLFPSPPALVRWTCFLFMKPPSVVFHLSSLWHISHHHSFWQSSAPSKMGFSRTNRKHEAHWAKNAHSPPNHHTQQQWASPSQSLLSLPLWPYRSVCAVKSDSFRGPLHVTLFSFIDSESVLCLTHTGNILDGRGSSSVSCERLSKGDSGDGGPAGS